MENKTIPDIDLLEKEIESLSQEVLNSYQEINLLYKISEKLGALTDLHDIAGTALEEVLAQVPARRASVMLINTDGESLNVVASKGMPPELGDHPIVKIKESLIEDVIAKGKPLLIDDLRDYPNLRARIKGGKYETFSMLAVPLIAVPIELGKQTFGTINLSDRQGEKQRFTSRDQKLLSAVAGQAAIAIKKIYLMEDLKLSQKETEEAFYYTVHALARGSEASDEDTGEHIIRVGHYAQILAGYLGMDSLFCNQIFHFAQMHDVGKMHIHPDILKKPGIPTKEEWEIIQSHCQKGADIIGMSPQLAMAREIALSHHERWDGTGYPLGLKGDKIPLSGRITNLSDIYDALRNKRAYKQAFDHEKTYEIITKGDGRTLPCHFDPKLLESFKACHRQFEEIFAELK